WKTSSETRGRWSRAAHLFPARGPAAVPLSLAGRRPLEDTPQRWREVAACCRRPGGAGLFGDGPPARFSPRLGPAGHGHDGRNDMAETSANRGRRELAAAELAVGKTHAAAAQAAHVSQRTIRTWAAEPDFSRRVSELRGQIVSRALGRMVGSLTAAAATL